MCACLGSGGFLAIGRALKILLADAVAKRYRPWPKGLRADSLPWFDSPLVQGASRLRYTDKAQMQRPGHTGRKALATKKKALKILFMHCAAYELEATLAVLTSLIATRVVNRRLYSGLMYDWNAILHVRFLQVPTSNT